jgi:hypothetical protein
MCSRFAEEKDQRLTSEADRNRQQGLKQRSSYRFIVVERRLQGLTNRLVGKRCWRRKRPSAALQGV